MDFLFNAFLLMSAALIYFIPSMIAMSKRHRNTLAIFLTNLMLGWVFGIGWAAALIWTVTEKAGDVFETAAATKTAKVSEPRTIGGILIKAGKLVGGIVALLVILMVLLFVLTPKSDEGQARFGAPGSETQKSGVKQGSPVAADELFK